MENISFKNQINDLFANYNIVNYNTDSSIRQTHKRDHHSFLKKTPVYDKMNLKKGVGKMPVLSIFYGIIVRMYREQGGKHNMPHIHAEYSGEEIVMALDGTILEGSFPKNKLKLLEAWVVIHRDDLEANWKLLSNGEQFFRIDPLK